MASSSTPVENLLSLNLLDDTTYQPEAPAGYDSSFKLASRNVDSRTTDYKDNEYCVTTFPQPDTEELRKDGHAEVMCTGWFKRKVMSTPGFPSPMVHPPKITYEIREMEGRVGYGMFATEDIAPGDLVVAERPLLVNAIWSLGNPQARIISKEQQLRGMYADMEKNMELICSRMSPETLEKYKSLHNSHKSEGSGPLTGIGRTNGFDVGVEDLQASKLVGQGRARYSAIGAISSRINHSCSPNVVHSFNIPSFAMEIHAVRRIAKGEEITVTYALLNDNAADRQTTLNPYKFTCACPACKDSKTSDQLRKTAISGLLPKSSQGVERADAALRAFEATGLQSHPRYHELLMRVAKIHRKKGSKERADELESLAERVTRGSRRNRTGAGTSSEPTPPAETHVITSPEDMIKLMNSVVARVNPGDRARIMQDLMRSFQLGNRDEGANASGQ
ncbi:unnamed protein product [Peniophora sp. CBMAI 1063]|nr:unnamed protein product [Peniophora sp. CBMAI 1063]